MNPNLYRGLHTSRVPVKVEIPRAKPALLRNQRLILSNCPVTISKQEIATYINTSLAVAGGCLTKESAIQLITPIPQSRQYYLVLRSEQQTQNCLQLNGLVIENRAIRLQYPPDASHTRKSVSLNLSRLNIKKMQDKVGNGPDRIYIGNLPYGCTEECLISILSQHGFLKSFHMSKNKHGIGFAYFSYHDEECASQCITKLHGQKLQDCPKPLIVKRVPYHVQDNEQPGSRAKLKPSNPQELAEQKFLTYPLNMVAGDRKNSTTLYLKGVLNGIPLEDIDLALKDIQRQMERVGKVVRVRVDSEGEGVIINFSNKELALMGLLVSSVRKFNGRPINAQLLEY